MGIKITDEVTVVVVEDQSDLEGVELHCNDTRYVTLTEDELEGLYR